MRIIKYNKSALKYILKARRVLYNQIKHLFYFQGSYKIATKLSNLQVSNGFKIKRTITCF